MFSETGKSFGRENDSSGIVDSCPGSGRPHTVHPIAKISKAKDLALILAYEVFMFCQRSIFSNRFLTLFTHSRLMRCLFSVGTKIAKFCFPGHCRLQNDLCRVKLTSNRTHSIMLWSGRIELQVGTVVTLANVTLL